MKNNVIPFNRTAKQKEATRVLANYLFSMLYGGSRSGKTFIIIRSIIFRALYKKSRHLIVRYRFNHVKTSIWYDTFPKVLAICFPGLKVEQNKTDWFVTFPNGSEIWFGGIDNKERAEKILGNEYSTIYANEASQLSWETIGLLQTRLAENSGLPLHFFMDCNPPSKAHWTYKVFIELKDPDSKEAKNPELYGHLLMNPTDNVENLPDGYIENTLDQLSKRQRDRFKLGLFTSDTEGALWKLGDIDKCRSEYKTWTELKKSVELTQIIIGLDPSVSSKPDSDLCGIIVIACAQNGKRYVIDDISMIASPNECAQAVIDAYNYYDANLIVYEKNQGGSWIEDLFRAKNFFGKMVGVHASLGKHARAEPVQALYEQNLVEHLDSEKLRALEEELTTYVPLQSAKSPDRLDGMVWAVSYTIKEGDTIAEYEAVDFNALIKRARGR